MGRKRTCYKGKQRNLVVSSKEIELEVNADRTKYMVMSPDQSAGQNHNIRFNNKSFEKVEQFKHLGTTLMKQILFRKKIRAERSQGPLAVIRCRIQDYKD